MRLQQSWSVLDNPPPRPPKDNGKNDHTWRVIHREAVSGSGIPRIFDAWHYEVIWACASTRLLWYVRNYVRLILYIMLHSTNLKPHCQMHFFACSQPCSEVHTWLHSTVHSQPAWLTLSSKLSRHSQSHSRACSQVHSQLDLMAHSQPAWLYATKSTLKTLSITLPSMLSSTLPIALDCTLPIALDGTLPIALDVTLPACLTLCSQVCSQDALNHTAEHALKYTPNCTWLHTRSLLVYTLPSKLSRRSQLHSRTCSQVHSQLHSMAHSQPAWLYAPK